MSRPVALITGASSGIGYELAKQFARHGFDLIVNARREANLHSLAKELAPSSTVHVVPGDLAVTSGAAKLHKAVTELGLTVDVLVNNAGVSAQGPLLDLARSDATNLINLNVRALTELTQLFGPEMVARGSGRILNVASTASFQAIPALSVYSASKAFVLSLTESLSEELKGSGVTVTALCPGPTKTEMMTVDQETQPVPEMFLADADAVAEEGYRACMGGEVIRVPGIANQAMVALLEFQPRWLVRFFSGLTARNSFGVNAR